MISFILIFFASAFNAVMDVCQFHYGNSIFVKFNKPKFFDGAVSWKNKYVNWDGGNRNFRKLFSFTIMKKTFSMNYPVQLTDAWHFAKSAMIILFALAVIFYSPVFNWWIDFLIMGVIWNFTFL